MRHAKWLVPALVVILALPVIAGEKKECTMSAQDCLDKMMVKMKDKGWVGIELDKSKDPEGLLITRVVPGSPAEAAGLQADDVLLAVNGAKYADNTEDHCATCEATKGNWSPGSEVHYLVARNGKDLKVKVTLGQVPPDVMAQWIGYHMLQHATVQVAQN